jgi:hypothetical protein
MTHQPLYRAIRRRLPELQSQLLRGLMQHPLLHTDPSSGFLTVAEPASELWRRLREAPSGLPLSFAPHGRSLAGGIPCMETEAEASRALDGLEREGRIWLALGTVRYYDNGALRLAPFCFVPVWIDQRCVRAAGASITRNTLLEKLVWDRSVEIDPAKELEPSPWPASEGLEGLFQAAERSLLSAVGFRADFETCFLGSWDFAPFEQLAQLSPSAWPEDSAPLPRGAADEDLEREPPVLFPERNLHRMAREAAQSGKHLRFRGSVPDWSPALANLAAAMVSSGRSVVVLGSREELAVAQGVLQQGGLGELILDATRGSGVTAALEEAWRRPRPEGDEDEASAAAWKSSQLQLVEYEAQLRQTVGESGLTPEELVGHLLLSDPLSLPVLDEARCVCALDPGDARGSRGTARAAARGGRGGVAADASSVRRQPKDRGIGRRRGGDSRGAAPGGVRGWRTP